MMNADANANDRNAEKLTTLSAAGDIGDGIIVDGRTDSFYKPIVLKKPWTPSELSNARVPIPVPELVGMEEHRITAMTVQGVQRQLKWQWNGSEC